MRSPLVISGITPVVGCIVMHRLLHGTGFNINNTPRPLLRQHRALCNDRCMTDELLGVTALAVELGVDRSTIHRRIAAEKLTPTAFVGRQPLFTRSDVERLKRGEQQLPQEVER